MAARVLIADDDVFWLRALQLILQLDHDVQATGSATEALEAVRSDAPDLVVLGWPMPGPNGTPLDRALRARLPGVPLLVASGTNDAGAGRNRKPIDAERLRDDVAKELGRSGTSRRSTGRARIRDDGRARSRAGA